MSPNDVLDMPVGMRNAFDDYMKNDIRERNKAARRR